MNSPSESLTQTIPLQRVGQGGVSLGSLITPQQISLWHRLISAAHRIVITCHKGPDGDAIGSSTALASWLRRQGKEATVVAPTIFPDFLKWMPGAADVLIFDKHEADVTPVVQAADLIIMVDHGELSRMAALGDVVAAHTAPRIMLDHHLDPQEGIAELVISHPELSSTCELLLRLMLEIGASTSSLHSDGNGDIFHSSDGEDLLTHDEAVCLYTGMMTDTGAFTYASSRPEIYELISLLLAKGIDKDKIYRNVFFTYSPDRLRLMGYLLYVKLEIDRKRHASIMTFTNAERRRFHTLNGDTEGFVNLPLQILGMKLSIFLREDTERPLIRVSLRSVDDFPCNEMAAEFFNGGGHKNAAGGEVWGTMDEAVKRTKDAINKYAPLLKA